MLRQGPEFNEVQKPSFELLRDRLGYDEYIPGEDLFSERSEAEVLLVGRLSKKLKEINPGLSDSGVKQAIDALRQPIARGLIEANEICHNILSRWTTVEEFVDGKPVGRSVRFIDFDHPEQNELLVVDEFVVKGPKRTRRLDLVIFLNGIPVAVGECKEPADKHGIAHAVRDLEVYQDPEEGVVKVFHTALFCFALKRSDARYGTVETKMSRYAQWKSYYPWSKFEIERIIGRSPTPQDQLLAGLLSRDNLLDHLRNFVVFDREGGRIIKKIARYQQFEAVNKAVARVLDPESRDPLKNRGGIVWHTQGSGKSLTMLWLSLKLRRQKKLENPTLLIVTDRTDLDKQISETFLNCGFENPTRAARVTHLRKMLKGPPGQTIMTTVQKFRDDVDLEKGSRHPILTDADNIFVLIDEAHRSEYGRFNANMRRALPNACIFGFTGTPIPKTTMAFGSYIHKYTMPTSVADGATVPILYEARLPQLAIWGNLIDPMFDSQFSDLTHEQKQKLKQQETTERRIYEAATDRIAAISSDIAEHYRENFEKDGFKAQVAAFSQKAAVQYHKELSKYFDGRVALLISGDNEKGGELNKYIETHVTDNEESIIDSFKKDGVDKLAIIVVVDKYLTGFDAPIERVLYLDKPLREHNLLQAIARVNRPLPEKNKTWGLVVDYWGVAGFLDRALAVFAEDIELEDVLHNRNEESFFNALQAAREKVFDLFPVGLARDDITPWLEALEPEDKRVRFLANYREFYRSLEQLLPDPRALEYLGDFSWLRKLRRQLMIQYSEPEDMTVSESSPKVRDLIDRYVKSDQVTVLLEPVSILDERFSEEVEKLTSERAKASKMEHALGKTINVKLHEDPVFYESLQLRLEKIITERKLERIDDVKEFQLLSQVREDMLSGQKESAESLGLDDDSLAVYGLLGEYFDIPEDDDSEKEQMVDLAQEIFETLKQEAVIDWNDKEDVQREMRRKIKRLLRFSDCPTNKIDELTEAVMNLARVRLKR